MIQHTLSDIDIDPLEREAGILRLIQGWLYHLGPTTALSLSQSLALAESTIQQVLLCLEASGLILRGVFTGITSFLCKDTSWMVDLKEGLKEEALVGANCMLYLGILRNGEK